MNWVDLVVLAVLALSGLLAFMRGLVREVLGLGAWIIAGVVASPYGVFPMVQPWTRQQFNDPTTADIIAFGGVFIVTLIVLWIIAGIVGGLVRDSVLGGLDRTLGLLFGIARGAVLVAVLYVLVGMAVPAEQWPQPVLQARALPTVYHGAEWLASQLPQGYRPTVTPPPAEKPTTSADLLQSRPEGRALGPRTSRD
jgi:membrane protein required for colicin V production